MKIELQCSNFDISLKDIQEATFLAAEKKVSVISFLPAFLIASNSYIRDYHNIKLGGLVDFPYGISPLELKQHTLIYAARCGAKVIDLVTNYSLIKNERFSELKKEILTCQAICNVKSIEMRLIVDYRLYTTEEIDNIAEFLLTIDKIDVITSTGTIVDDPIDNLMFSHDLRKVTENNVIPASNCWKSRHITHAQDDNMQSTVIISLPLFKNLLCGV